MKRPLSSIFILILCTNAFSFISSIRSVEFVCKPLDAANAEHTAGKILILVNETLYPGISAALITFQEDLTMRGFLPVLYTLEDGMTPPDIKTIIRSFYTDQNVSGCILVGDVPVAYSEIRCGDSLNVLISLDAIDMYYMDLDGYWENVTHPDFYAHRSPNDTRQVQLDSSCTTFYDEYIVYPNETRKWDYGTIENKTQYRAEIWVSRIMGHNLEIPGKSEAQIVKDFLEWDHMYRCGMQQVSSKAYMLNACGEGYNEQNMNYSRIFNQIVKEEYLEKNVFISHLGDACGSELLYLTAHSSPRLHQMYHFSDTVTVDELLTLRKSALFYILNTCSACRWDYYSSSPSNPNYLGGLYVFGKSEHNRDYGLGAIGFTGVGGFNNLGFFSDFLNENIDGYYGMAYKYYFNNNLDLIFGVWNYVFLGDPTIGPRRLTVRNLTTGLDYSTIQSAIDAPETLDGHTIEVHDGTYCENVIVHKSLNLKGENRSITIVDGCCSGGAVFRVYADRVNITGFTVRNARFGLHFTGCNDCYVSEDLVTACEIGLYLESSTNIIVTASLVDSNYIGVCLYLSDYCFVNSSSITNCTGAGVQFQRSHNCGLYEGFLSNDRMALYIYDCTGCGILENTIVDNDVSAYVYSSTECTIRENLINNTTCGIQVLYSSKCFVGANTVANSHGGLEPSISVQWSDDTDLVKNTVSGAEWACIEISHCKNCQVLENNASNAHDGIAIYLSNNSRISENTVTNCSSRGIYVFESVFCEVAYNFLETSARVFELQGLNQSIVVGNTVKNSWALFTGTEGHYENTVFDNNFISCPLIIVTETVRNTWDDGSEGNYWSDYSGVDLCHGINQNETGSDGIGDAPYYVKDEWGNITGQDRYPLIGAFSDFNATLDNHVAIVSNSTISAFQFCNDSIMFGVSGESGTTGFCRIRIPKAIMDEPCRVLVNGTEVDYALLPCSNTTYSYLYFTYEHSIQAVEITIPEFTSTAFLALLMTIIMLIIIICGRRRSFSRSREKPFARASPRDFVD